MAESRRPQYIALEQIAQHRSGGRGPNHTYLVSIESIAGLDSLSREEAYEVGRALARLSQWMDLYIDGDKVRIDKLLPVLEQAIARRPHGTRFAAEEAADVCHRFMTGLFLECGVDAPAEIRADMDHSLTGLKKDVIAFAISGGTR
jgi:hypothetical protein